MCSIFGSHRNHRIKNTTDLEGMVHKQLAKVRKIVDCFGVEAAQGRRVGFGETLRAIAGRSLDSSKAQIESGLEVR